MWLKEINYDLLGGISRCRLSMLSSLEGCTLEASHLIYECYLLDIATLDSIEFARKDRIHHEKDNDACLEWHNIK